MRVSLATRLYRTIFLISIVNITITTVMLDIASEQLESTMLDIDLVEDQRFFEKQVRKDKGAMTNSARETSTLNALFVPEGETPPELPDYFRNISAPYLDEVETGAVTHLVIAEHMDNPAGTLFIAKDITRFESREFHYTVVLLVVGILMLGFSFLLAQLGARRLVQPLRRLTHAIQRTTPGKDIERLSTDYIESEFVDIANTFNSFLDALEAYVQREKSLVTLASHELRTPLAIISGALDVMEDRKGLGEVDLRTLGRVRRATDTMRMDVDVLLKLARREGEENARPLNLSQCINEAVAEISASQPEHAGRILEKNTNIDLLIKADPALVRMLLRNLLQNALKHTRRKVCVELGERGMLISDEGPGLPEPVQERLATRFHAGRDRSLDGGLGLFIVQLICDRLKWNLIVKESGTAGTVLELRMRRLAE